MCEEWRNSSQKFLSYLDENLGEKPSPQHTIDRIDNEEGYKPGNIRWATRKEQNSNRRSFLINRKSRSGFKWVKPHKNKFIGKFRTNYEYIYCGSFSTPEDAYKAVCEKRKELNLPL